jgi:hypothetical protein
MRTASATQAAEIVPIDAALIEAQTTQSTPDRLKFRLSTARAASGPIFL